MEFVAELRHYCRNKHCRSKLPSPVANARDRNKHCRSKLPSPVANAREAFCTRGCYNSFYLRRCVVCKQPIVRKREDQKVCRRPKCRNAWAAWIASSLAN